MATPAFHQPGRLLTRRVGRLCLEGHSWDPRDLRTGLSLDRQANRTHDNPFHEGIPASHGCANGLDERSWRSGSYFVLVYVCPALSSRERERPGVERRVETRRFDRPKSRIEQMDGREPAAASWMGSRPRLEISPRRRLSRLAGWPVDQAGALTASGASFRKLRRGATLVVLAGRGISLSCAAAACAKRRSTSCVTGEEGSTSGSTSPVSRPASAPTARRLEVENLPILRSSEARLARSRGMDVFSTQGARLVTPPGR
jgi:hypothetical protein